MGPTKIPIQRVAESLSLVIQKPVPEVYRWTTYSSDPDTYSSGSWVAFLGDTEASAWSLSLNYIRFWD